MRPAKANDFFITLDGVGTFRYGRRTLGDRLAIRRDYLRLTEEFGDNDPDLSLFAAMIATHNVLCATAPDGWEDLATLDQTDPKQSLELVFELSSKIKQMEDSFAKGVEKSGEDQSEGDGGDGGVRVSPEIQSPAA